MSKNYFFLLFFLINNFCFKFTSRVITPQSSFPNANDLHIVVGLVISGRNLFKNIVTTLVLVAFKTVGDDSVLLVGGAQIILKEPSRVGDNFIEQDESKRNHKFLDEAKFKIGMVICKSSCSRQIEVKSC